jgi:hypothetical protein
LAQLLPFESAGTSVVDGRMSCKADRAMSPQPARLPGEQNNAPTAVDGEQANDSHKKLEQGGE